MAASLFAADGYVFAGLSLRSTVEEARQRYSHSEIVGSQVYIADADSHDNIYAIDLPRDGVNRQLRLFFERAAVPRDTYPPCEQLLTRLRKEYGPAANVQEFDEERARNRRYIWSRGEEEMSLLCFRFGAQPFLASELAISARPKQ